MKHVNVVYLYFSPRTQKNAKKIFFFWQKVKIITIIKLGIFGWKHKQENRCKF